MTTLLEHLCARCEPHWRQYIQHPFVLQLADGTREIDFWQMGLDGN